eukprot:835874-Rhodomonas_salina.1
MRQVPTLPKHHRKTPHSLITDRVAVQIKIFQCPTQRTYAHQPSCIRSLPFEENPKMRYPSKVPHKSVLVDLCFRPFHQPDCGSVVAKILTDMPAHPQPGDHPLRWPDPSQQS